jgi:hypothetical protein
MTGSIDDVARANLHDLAASQLRLIQQNVSKWKSRIFGLTKSQNETSQERSDILNRSRNLLSQSSMHEMSITFDPGSDLSTPEIVEETDLLVQTGPQEPFSDPTSSQLGGSLPDNHVGIRAGEGTDTDVDEVGSVESGTSEHFILSGLECGNGIDATRLSFVSRGSEIGERPDLSIRNE